MDKGETGAERERTVVKEIKWVENWGAGINGRQSGREKMEQKRREK